jgi:hypothetical protein
MILRFFLHGALLTGLSIGASNIWLAKRTDSDEKIVKAAVYRAVRYGVLWPKTWLETFEKYQRGEDWQAIFCPDK